MAAHAIQLVQKLGLAQYSAQVPAISKEIQSIQRSSEAWQIAGIMLDHEDANVKFYGLLTLQVKLNAEGAQLEHQAAAEILARLLSHLVHFTLTGERKFVIDKAISALTTYFLKTPLEWKQAVRQILCTLFAEAAVSEDDLAKFPDTRQIAEQLAPAKLLAALRFAQVFAEDVYNGASLSRPSHLDERIKASTADTATLLAYSLDIPDTDIMTAALECFTAWIAYGHHNWQTDPVSLQFLRGVTPIAIRHLLNDDEDVRSPTVDLFVSILEYRHKFLDKEQMEMIAQLVLMTLGPQCATSVLSREQDPSIAPIAKLVTAYGKLAIKDIIAFRQQPKSVQTVDLFLALLRGPGLPAEEDEIVISATDFWTEYAELTVDAVVDSTESELPWLAPLRNDFAEALQCYIPKLRAPPPEVFKQWDDETMDQWSFFRDNINDFLQSVNNIPDTGLLPYFTTLALQTLPNKSWLDLEAVLFCINCVADTTSLTQTENIQAFSQLMQSSLFNDVSSHSATIPGRVKRTVLRLIDAYAQFVKKNPAYLPPVLTFLFNTLETSSADQSKLGDSAAKTFESLCSSCRRRLTQHLGELLEQCPRALAGPSINVYQKEKVMAALASVIQALPSEEAKAAPLLALVTLIESDLNTAVALIHAGDVEKGELLGTAGLQYLASIGKGIQALDELIDLEDDEDESNDANGVSAPNFWTTGPGAAVQERILSCFNIVTYLQNQGEAIDAACAVLRAGLAETTPGPFVFPPSATVGFVQKAHLHTPHIEAILTTACAFVSANSRRSSRHMFAEVLAVYETVARIANELDDPVNDPSLAQICIDFLQRLLTSYIDVLLAPSDEDIYRVLSFAVRCMTGEAPMLKRHAASFFETLLGIARPGSPTKIPPSRVEPSAVISVFGPILASALMQQMCGLAQRSELEALSKPLRAFVFGQVDAKKWLEDALIGAVDDPTHGRAGEKEKRVFLQKLISLRGGRKTSDVVREWWAMCKGTVSSFE